jgi:hypothetical protein
MVRWSLRPNLITLRRILHATYISVSKQKLLLSFVSAAAQKEKEKERESGVGEYKV